MKEKILACLSWIVVVVSFVHVLRICAKEQNSNNAKSFMCKVFYHETVQKIDSSVLLNGQLAIYFSSSVNESVKPLLLSKNSIDPHHEEYVFFFAGTQILNDECRRMIERTAEKNTDDCTILITETVSPELGILIKIIFNPEKIALQYATFTSISGQQGIEFRFINQSSLGAALKNVNGKKTTKIACARPRVVIDPGHGGSDSGAKGRSGILEKNICLSIAKMTHNLLIKRGYSVLLTRSNDSSVGLDKRTSMANNFQADLFISIHANSDSKKKGFGVETFFLKESSVLDNFLTPLSIKEKKIVASICKARQEESRQFAGIVQSMIIEKTGANDRSIKQAVSQVLLGTQMPAVLIEVGFLSNTEEEKLLSTCLYQKKIAEAIDQAVAQYYLV